MYTYPGKNLTYKLIHPTIAIPVTIKDFEHYKVSYWGGYVINTRNGSITKGWSNKESYRRVDLRNGDKRSNQYVHRLVCCAWKSNPENKSDVNHIDRIRWNNNATNLEHLTHAENMAYIESEPIVEPREYCPF